MSGSDDFTDGSRHRFDGSGGDGGFPQQPGESGNVFVDLLMSPFQAVGNALEIGG